MDKLWVDKYRPRQLGELTYHHNVTEVLSQLATRDDFPHMLFYGPLGAGKKTRVYCFLEAIFGNGVYKLKSEEKVIKLENTSTSVECFVISSNYHLETCPADSENNDRHVVQRVIKEAASNQNIDAKSVKQHSFKVIIINDADRLTKEAQAALRRTMEKYMSACRIIMICENRNKIIAPIRSRCLNIRIGAPNTDSIVEALELIDNKESLSYSAQVLTSLASNCNGNLRSAILGLQMWKNNKGHTTNKTDSLKPLWMAEIGTIVKSIIEEQSPNKLKTLRDQFYELLINGVDGSLILNCMIAEFTHQSQLEDSNTKKRKLSDMTLMKIIHEAAEHEVVMNEGSKFVYHLEAFAAHCMLAIQEGRDGK